MTAPSLPTRRFKLPSELTESDRAQLRQLGTRRLAIEREEYRKARKALLASSDEHDPALVVRLLREEAEILRHDGAEQAQQALEALSPEDWEQRPGAWSDDELEQHMTTESALGAQS